MAELGERPFPPGDYPVVVVGSGPGGIQSSYYLRHLGIEHAVISAEPSPGGMFRRFPFFQRLLSWTKPYAPVSRDDPFYYWYDWNSLLAEEPENRALQADLMDGTSSFPSRPEMELNLATFVERTGLKIRYETAWQSTSRDGDRFVIRPASSSSRTTPTRVRRIPTRASGCSSWARRTVASSLPPACSSGRSGSCSPRLGRRS